MKKILASLAIIAVVSAASVTATKAYFSDTETSSGNTFSAGTLKLTTNGTPGVVKGYSLSNIHPGSWDNAGQVILENIGTIHGHAWVELKNPKNCLAAALVSDPTCALGSSTGGLGDVAIANFQENNDLLHIYTRFGSTNTPINTVAGTSTRIDLIDLNPGDTLPLVVYGIWPNGTPATDNPLQGSAVVFDAVFHLDQIIP